MGKMRPFEVDEVLDALYGHFADQLSPWESTFIGSVQAQWRRTQHLSDKQERKLLEIWDGFASGRRRKALGAEPPEGDDE